MTKQELVKDIRSVYPQAIRLNTKETATVIGKHENRVREYMRGCRTDKVGCERFYYVIEIAERMLERSGYA